MPDASLTLALAGGAGAAIGAGVGQLVQWWREHVRTGIEERRRDEDRAEAREKERREYKRAAYVELIGLGASLTERIDDVVRTAGDVYEVSKPEFYTEMFLRNHSPARSAFDECLTRITTLSSAYGSTEVEAVVAMISACRIRLTQSRHLGLVMPRFSVKHRPEGLVLHRTGFNTADAKADDEFWTVLDRNGEILQGQTRWLIARARFELDVDQLEPDS